MILLPEAIPAMPEDDDRDYMEWLYFKYYRLMYSAAWRVFENQADVDDVVSESCLKLMKKIPELKRMDQTKLGAYIVAAVRNTALNLLDRKESERSHAVGYSETVENTAADCCEVEKRICLEEELAVVWRAISCLPEKERQIMRMKYAVNMSDEEIAERTGLSTGSIRKYIGRAREHIRMILYKE